MSDDQAPLLLAVAVQNDELREQLGAAQTLLLETAIEAGQLHARLEALQAERDVWRHEAERLSGRRAHSPESGDGVARSAGFGRIQGR